MVPEGGDGSVRPVPTVAGFVDLVLIGHGGSSTVYAATQVALQRRVALKVLNDIGDQTRRLEREAKALVALSGAPHIVQVHDVVATADGHSVLVMPLLEESLTARVRATGPQPLATVSRWATQLALGLDAAHRRGIAHRDIKPENVLLSAEGDAYLVDFGIAELQEMDSGTITVASISPPHAPPERFTDESTGDGVTGDIYSLGSTLYFALAAHPAFGTMSDGGSLGLMHRITAAELPPLPGVPAPVHDAIARAMAKRPAERFADVMAFAEALNRAAGTAWESPPRPPPLPEWMQYPATPNKWFSDTGPELVLLQDDGHTRVKAPGSSIPAVAPPAGAPPPGPVAEVPDHEPVPTPRPRRRTLVAVALAVACIGAAVGFVAFRDGWPNTTTRPMQLVVKDQTSENPLPASASIRVNGIPWTPTFQDRRTTRTFHDAFRGDDPAVVELDVPQQETVRVPRADDDADGTQVVTVVIGDDSVRVGATKRPRINPAAEARRVRGVLEPLNDYDAQAWLRNQQILPAGQSVPYSVVQSRVDAEILPLIDKGIALIKGVSSPDRDVQAGIDAFLRCWNLKHAFFVDEMNPDDATVPADPADTYETRQRAADAAADAAALEEMHKACKSPAVTALRGS